MALINIPNTFTVGATIVASQHNANFSTIYSDYNGNITDANISPTASISNTKLAQITTAGTVSGAALTSLSSIPSGAGAIPSKNGGTGSDLSAAAQGAIPYFSATGVESALSAGTSGQVLTTQGAAANPVWATPQFGTVTTGLLAGTTYTAAADGLIFVSAEGIASGNVLQVLADSSNPPTTNRGYYRSQAADGRASMTVPIKSGINYKVALASGSIDAYEFWTL